MTVANILDRLDGVVASGDGHDITPSVTSIDWSGTRPAPALDAATEASCAALYQAIDARLSALPKPTYNWLYVPQPDHTTTQVIEVGLAVADVTDDALAADTLFRLCEHVVALREDAQTAQLLRSASLAHLHHQHCKATADREGRHAR